MSTDYDVVCDSCKEYMHFGQRRYLKRYSLAYGRLDDDEDVDKVWGFITKHSECSYEEGIRIVLSASMFGKDNDYTYIKYSGQRISFEDRKKEMNELKEIHEKYEKYENEKKDKIKNRIKFILF